MSVAFFVPFRFFNDDGTKEDMQPLISHAK
jgi:hypothetical protein